MVFAMSELFARTPKRYRAQEPEFRTRREQPDLVSVLQEELESGMIFTVEVIVNIFRQVAADIVQVQSEFWRPSRRDGGDVLRQ